MSSERRRLAARARALETLAEYAIHADRQDAADCLGVPARTVRHRLERLGPGPTLVKLARAGWLRVPLEAAPNHAGGAFDVAVPPPAPSGG